MRCSASLKKAYGHQTEGLLWNNINHIMKIEFLPFFKAAFDSSIVLSNILRGFRDAGLVPFDPEAVIKRLDNRPSTFVELIIKDSTWQPKNPSNTLELGSRSRLIGERLQR